ncbi:receptor-like protein 9DC3 [Rhododendron vialii]|uniref:receptor-like protein 9DC3 n=1 Tax=Rhododendron vialii TaxID=182163 RepID=UPI00265EA365|nr:receptor-like protein 9DC3 [Rhododendron vialii]
MGLQQVWLSYNLLFNLFFFFLFLCQITCLHAQLCTQEQNSALLQLKGSFSLDKSASSYCDYYGITSFPKMESWKKGSDCCSWYGVECDRETAPQRLNLSESAFSGKVPPGVSYLNKLVSLDLSYNFHLRLEEGGFELLIQNLSKLRDLDLSGINISSSVFPNFLLNLTSLRTLGLRESGLHGEVRPRVSYLNKLVSLDLSYNFDLRLEEGGFELLIQNLSKLRDLDLSEVNMSSSVVPNSLLNLTSLRTLGLRGSGLHGEVRPRVSYLNKLVSLDLSYNFDLRLEEDGFELLIQNLSKLRDLSLIGVNMSSSVVPNSMLNLTFLRTLRLGESGLHGEFPSRVFHLPHLHNLVILYEEGILPDSIANLKSLKQLVIRHSEFHGSIPTSLWSLTQITYLGLSSNNFHGILPSSISNLTQITSLDLSSNNFSGTIPSWVFELPALMYLDLSYNKLIGHTLEFQSSSLKFIDLSNNDLNGTVPNSTFELQNLTHLILSSNSFSGTIPRSNRFSKNLNVLALKMNNFFGTIHDSFTRRNSLTTINLYGNGFEGPIPKSLINSRYLEVLDLGRNKFFDEFPHWLGNLPYLHVLILQSNKFHGSIVTSTTKFPFPMLRVLDMANNNFTGPLPIKYFKSFKAMMNVDEHFDLEYMGTGSYYDSLTIVIKGSTIDMEQILTVFTAVDLSSNKFDGEIPEIIGRLNSIRGLNLSHNSLTGHIPKSLGNLTKLEWLDLSSNKLTGEIPRQLTNLTFLGTLNLSQNRLTGPIPRGKQFDTFSNGSYINNSALCGPPLSNTCGDPKAAQPPPSRFEEEDSDPLSGIGWEVVLPGYGFGLVVGLVMGYLMFSFGKPHWLVKVVEGVIVWFLIPRIRRLRYENSVANYSSAIMLQQPYRSYNIAIRKFDKALIIGPLMKQGTQGRSLDRSQQFGRNQNHYPRCYNKNMIHNLQVDLVGKLYCPVMDLCCVMPVPRWTFACAALAQFTLQEMEKEWGNIFKYLFSCAVHML